MIDEHTHRDATRDFHIKRKSHPVKPFVPVHQQGGATFTTFDPQASIGTAPFSINPGGVITGKYMTSTAGLVPFMVSCAPVTAASAHSTLQSLSLTSIHTASTRLEQSLEITWTVLRRGTVSCEPGTAP